MGGGGGGGGGIMGRQRCQRYSFVIILLKSKYVDTDFSDLAHKMGETPNIL